MLIAISSFLGQEWAVFKLGFPGKIFKVCVDTAHFKGNYPDSVKIEGAYLGSSDWSEETEHVGVGWKTILGPAKVRFVLKIMLCNLC